MLTDENDNHYEEEHENECYNVKKEDSCSDVTIKEDDKETTKATKNNCADKEVEEGNGKCDKNNENNSFFDKKFH